MITLKQIIENPKQLELVSDEQLSTWIAQYPFVSFLYIEKYKRNKTEAQKHQTAFYITHRDILYKLDFLTEVEKNKEKEPILSDNQEVENLKHEVEETPQVNESSGGELSIADRIILELNELKKGNIVGVVDRLLNTTTKQDEPKPETDQDTHKTDEIDEIKTSPEEKVETILEDDPEFEEEEETIIESSIQEEEEEHHTTTFSSNEIEENPIVVDSEIDDDSNIISEDEKEQEFVEKQANEAIIESSVQADVVEQIETTYSSNEIEENNETDKKELSIAEQILLEIEQLKKEKATSIADETEQAVEEENKISDTIIEAEAQESNENIEELITNESESNNVVDAIEENSDATETDDEDFGDETMLPPTDEIEETEPEDEKEEQTELEKYKKPKPFTLPNIFFSVIENVIDKFTKEPKQEEPKKDPELPTEDLDEDLSISAELEQETDLEPEISDISSIEATAELNEHETAELEDDISIDETEDIKVETLDLSQKIEDTTTSIELEDDIYLPDVTIEPEHTPIQTERSINIDTQIDDTIDFIPSSDSHSIKIDADNYIPNIEAKISRETLSDEIIEEVDQLRGNKPKQFINIDNQSITIETTPSSEIEIKHEVVFTDDTIAEDIQTEKEDAQEETHTFLEWLQIVDKNFEQNTQRLKIFFAPYSYETQFIQEHKKELQQGAILEGEVDSEDDIDEDVNKMADESIAFKKELATETLAKIFIKQEKYDKAIEIYRKLILRYPEKSSTFVAQIEELEKKL